MAGAALEGVCAGPDADVVVTGGAFDGAGDDGAGPVRGDAGEIQPEVVVAVAAEDSDFADVVALEDLAELAAEVDDDGPDFLAVGVDDPVVDLGGVGAGGSGGGEGGGFEGDGEEAAGFEGFEGHGSSLLRDGFVM